MYDFAMHIYIMNECMNFYIIYYTFICLHMSVYKRVCFMSVYVSVYVSVCVCVCLRMCVPV